MDPGGPVAEAALSGRRVKDTPAFTAWAPDITPDGRIGDWSDAELARAIREGLRPDGSLIGPPVPIPACRGLSVEDLAAVVVCLRIIKVVENVTPASACRVPLPPAYGLPVAIVVPPPRGGHGRVWRIPRDERRPLHGVPYADGAAGAGTRRESRLGWVRVRRPPGRLARARPGNSRGRAGRLPGRRDRGDDRGRAPPGRKPDAAHALSPSRADDA